MWDISRREPRKFTAPKCGAVAIEADLRRQASRLSPSSARCSRCLLDGTSPRKRLPLMNVGNVGNVCARCCLREHRQASHDHTRP
jgi:hypothetical protein